MFLHVNRYFVVSTNMYFQPSLENDNIAAIIETIFSTNNFVFPNGMDYTGGGKFYE